MAVAWRFCCSNARRRRWLLTMSNNNNNNTSVGDDHCKSPNSAWVEQANTVHASSLKRTRPTNLVCLRESSIFHYEFDYTMYLTVFKWRLIYCLPHSYSTDYKTGFRLCICASVYLSQSHLLIDFDQNWHRRKQEAQLKQGLADRTAKTAVSVAI